MKNLILTEKDLLEIYSLAVNDMINLSTRSLYQTESILAQSYAFTCAVIQFLNKKELLKELITVDDKLNSNYIKD